MMVCVGTGDPPYTIPPMMLTGSLQQLENDLDWHPHTHHPLVGAAIPTICGGYDTPALCDADVHCFTTHHLWCVVCVLLVGRYARWRWHCAEINCTADTANMCQWNSTTDTCQRAECKDLPTKEKCEEKDMCTFDVTKTPPCDDKPCVATTQQKCDDLGENVCKAKVCVHGSKTLCTADIMCQWGTSGACEAAPC
eukprot:gene51426-57713_t